MTFVALFQASVVRGIHTWATARLEEHGDAQPTEAIATPDYHALDRLYALESEERNERRGLETRAAATIAAALASVAFSANAVSGQLKAAGCLPATLLAVGAGFLLLGILATSVSLFGRSRFAVLALQIAGRVVSWSTIYSPALRSSSEARAQLSAAIARRRAARKADDRDQVREANREINRAIARFLVYALPGRVGLPLDLAVMLLGARTKEDRGDQDEVGDVRDAEPRTNLSLREPDDLDAALEVADQEAQRLRAENAAMVAVLRVTSLLLGLGIVVLATGVVVLLIQSPVKPTS